MEITENSFMFCTQERYFETTIKWNFSENRYFIV